MTQDCCRQIITFKKKKQEHAILSYVHAGRANSANLQKVNSDLVQCFLC